MFKIVSKLPLKQHHSQTPNPVGGESHDTTRAVAEATDPLHYSGSG